MIYFVDEDIGQIEQWASILRMRGYQTFVLRDADSAVEHLRTCNDIQLVFIDIMLAVSSRPEARRFGRAETDNFHSTGVELLKILAKERPGHFPACAIMLSQAVQSRIIEKIKKASAEFSVPFWPKSSFTNVIDFATSVEEALNNRATN